MRRHGRVHETAQVITLIFTAGVLSLLGGCRETPYVRDLPRGSVMDLEIRTLPRPIEISVPETSRIKVAVEPFEDARLPGSRMGTLDRLWGRNLDFSVAGGPVGKVLAQVLAGYSRQQVGWNAWLAVDGVVPPAGGPELVITGRVLTFRVMVRDWGVVARAQIRMLVTVQVSADGKAPSRVVLDHEDRTWLMRTSPEAISRLLNRVLRSQFDELLATVSAEHGD